MAVISHLIIAYGNQKVFGRYWTTSVHILPGNQENESRQRKINGKKLLLIVNQTYIFEGVSESYRFDQFNQDALPYRKKIDVWSIDLI